MFLIEGVHLVEECLESLYYSHCIDKVFIRNDFNNKKLLRKLDNADLDIIRLDDKQFHSFTETVNSQGIVAVVSINLDNKNYSANESVIVALDNMNDPGNAGAILRTARWFGVNTVLLNSGSVDVFNSKVLRASQGAVFNLNINQNVNLIKDLENYFNKGFKIFLTDVNADVSLDVVEFSKEEKYVIVFGNEAGGISKEILENKSYCKLKIKGYSESESLNVAVAAGIVLYQARCP